MRPNAGASLRPEAESPRRHCLYADVTEEERVRIQNYCLEHRVSVSEFLAEVVLKRALEPGGPARQKVVVTAQIELTAEEMEKLELLARLYEKESVGELILEVLRPELELRKVHGRIPLTSLRYYLSDEEREIVMRHLEDKGIAARNYAAMLAVKAIAESSRRRK